MLGRQCICDLAAQATFELWNGISLVKDVLVLSVPSLVMTFVLVSTSAEALVTYHVDEGVCRI
jgi:hypothetical protein